MGIFILHQPLADLLQKLFFNKPLIVSQQMVDLIEKFFRECKERIFSVNVSTAAVNRVAQRSVWWA